MSIRAVAKSLEDNSPTASLRARIDLATYSVLDYLRVDGLVVRDVPARFLIVRQTLWRGDWRVTKSRFARSFVRSAYDKGLFHLLSTNFISQALGFGTLLVLARVFDPEEMGQLKVLQSYGAVFTLLAGFGINTAVLRFCALPEAGERQAIFRAGLRLTALTACLAWAAFAALSFVGFRSSTGAMRPWFLIYSIVIPLTAITTLLSAYLHANKLMKVMASLQGWFRAVTFLFVLCISYWIGFGGFVFGSVIGSILLLIAHVRRVSDLATFRGPIEAPLGFARMAAWSLAANGVMMVGGYADVFLLDRFLPNRAEIGFYSIATFFMMAGMQVTSAIQAVVTPYFAEKTTDLKWMRKQVLRVQLLTLLSSLPLAAGSFTAAWLLVHYYYGAQYVRVLEVLPLLLGRYVLHASYAIVGVALLAANRVNINFAAATAASIANFLAGLALLPRYGIIGVALAQLVGPMIALIFTYAAARHVFRFGRA